MTGPGDDALFESDVRIDGAPAGIVVRALGGAHGFKGASVLIVPGTPMRAVLLMADGAGTDLAATPVYDVGNSALLHVRLVARGNVLQAQVGRVELTATMPADMTHGDVAFRAYPGGSLEATAITMRKP
jgi:hypothetical protein